MKLVGLTGGIGCGKSTVVNVFREIGVPCFVADDEAGKYYDDPLFLEEIRRLLGDKVFSDTGKVDKRKIAQIVFNDKEKLSQLNSLIHPRVMRQFKGWAQRQDSDYVIIESAILYEYDLDKQLDKIVAVYIDREECIQRLEHRSNEPRDVIEARINNQLSAEEKMDRADYVILNFEGNPRERQVRYIDRMLRNVPAGTIVP